VNALPDPKVSAYEAPEGESCMNRSMVLECGVEKAGCEASGKAAAVVELNLNSHFSVRLPRFSLDICPYLFSIFQL
jgi:hypothetical protein